jgi:NitT/TauT family transport system ATP-binding protein
MEAGELHSSSDINPRPHNVPAGDGMIQIRNLTKVFRTPGGLVRPVENFSLSVGEGEFVSIVGPSGCGKSTILNLVAKFITPTSGNVIVSGQPETNNVPDGLGYIFQKDTLLPWYTVRKNVGLGLKFAGAPQEDIDRKVNELLELGHLTGFADAFPHQLSGGMRRRVALLMSLAVEPRILLLDEPFSALDAHTRTHLHHELLEIWRKLKQTVVMVTHDLDEAITLSTRVIVLSRSPSRILLDEPIKIPYPRDVFKLRELSEFSRYYQHIWGVLANQYRAEV